MDAGKRETLLIVIVWNDWIVNQTEHPIRIANNIKIYNLDIIIFIAKTSSYLVLFYNVEIIIYGHLRFTIEQPHSSYSALLIHISWKVPILARILPPNQLAMARSCIPGDITLTFHPGV